MSINWKHEVEVRKELLLEDLKALLSIDSVRKDELATQESPVGPGPKEALEAFLAIGNRDGFITKNVDNLAGHIEYGQGNELMGVFGHVDVVPVGTGWETDPFTPVIKNNRLYARGSSDDKGPTVAAYYGLKIIKELGLPVSKKVRLIIGTDEESGWKCMERYMSVEQVPDFGFSPDAEFPIINGEKGILTLAVQFNSESSHSPIKLNQFHAGLRENMVPQDAKAVVSGIELAVIEKSLEDFVLKNDEISAKAFENNTNVVIEVVGKAAHGSMPEKGINAATYLALFLNQYAFDNLDKLFLTLIAQELHNDFYAKKLGVSYTDEVMGHLSMNPGVFEYENGKGKILLNFRYPKGVTAEQLENNVLSALNKYDITIQSGKSQIPHYVPASDPLVKTLLSVYEKQTGLKGHEQTIGGGTYGRLLKRGVAFGAMFPESIDTMHQANEFIDLDDLFNAASIYAEAIYKLIK